MVEAIEFNSNYTDHSNEEGFQFEFFCNRCESGFRTRYKPYNMGKVSGAMDTASSLFGGLFGKAADLTNRMSTANYERAREAAFLEAVAELKGEFVQCPRCNSWICRKKCWSNKRGLCKECAPDLGVEMSAAQASKSVEEVWAHAAMAEEDKKLAEGNWRQTIKASCPKCGSALASNAKFCPECGEKLKVETKCPSCGAKLLPGAKFCAECGEKLK